MLSNISHFCLLTKSDFFLSAYVVGYAGSYQLMLFMLMLRSFKQAMLVIRFLKFGK